MKGSKDSRRGEEIGARSIDPRCRGQGWSQSSKPTKTDPREALEDKAKRGRDRTPGVKMFGKTRMGGQEGNREAGDDWQSTYETVIAAGAHPAATPPKLRCIGAMATPKSEVGFTLDAVKLYGVRCSVCRGILLLEQMGQKYTDSLTQHLSDLDMLAPNEKDAKSEEKKQEKPKDLGPSDRDIYDM